MWEVGTPLEGLQGDENNLGEGDRQDRHHQGTQLLMHGLANDHKSGGPTALRGASQGPDRKSGGPTALGGASQGSKDEGFVFATLHVPSGHSLRSKDEGYLKYLFANTHHDVTSETVPNHTAPIHRATHDGLLADDDLATDLGAGVRPRVGAAMVESHGMALEAPEAYDVSPILTLELDAESEAQPDKSQTGSESGKESELEPEWDESLEEVGQCPVCGDWGTLAHSCERCMDTRLLNDTVDSDDFEGRDMLPPPVGARVCHVRHERGDFGELCKKECIW